MTTRADFVEALAGLPAGAAEEIVVGLGEAQARRLLVDWGAWAHGGQREPAGAWRVWVMLAGRGFGKTRAGAEWVEAFARDHPEASIALVAASVDEARRVMIEGRSGLLALPRLGKAPVWQPTLRRLTFASGAVATIYSGSEPEGLRGPEHHAAWCDELAKWRRPRDAWDNLQLGLRVGERPRTVVTTTPRNLAALKAILGEEGVVRTGGGTWDNPFLARAAVAALTRIHGGTRLGRQELEGALIEEVEGALWPRALIEASRDAAPPERDSLWRVVVGVDPPASAQGTCGIVVCGIDGSRRGYVLADHSVAGLSPEGWGRKVGAAAEAHRAVRVVAEANNGGAMVEAVLRGSGVALPVRLVHASEGKVARAAPVAALFESGQARFAGRFPALEDQLAGLSWGGGYEGPGASPDRADAMVWALTDLLLGKRRREPRIVRL